MALLLLLGAGCNDDLTQIVIEVRSDMRVPDQLDGVNIEMVRADGETMDAAAMLGPGENPLPRRLGVVWEDGSLGPFRTHVVGSAGGSERVRYVGNLTFEQGSVRTWVVELNASCMDVDCTEGETCVDGSCTAVMDEPLDPFVEPTPFDAGPDAGLEPVDAGPECLAEELCNEQDDDCDGDIDEGIDTQTDIDNCGRCGNACENILNTMVACMNGICAVTGCAADFADCGAEPGCETNTLTDDNNCGGCGTRCNGNRECCDGECLNCR